MRRREDLETIRQRLKRLNPEDKAMLRDILNYNSNSEELRFDGIKKLIEAIRGIVELDRQRGVWRIALSFNNTNKMQILVTPANRYMAEEEFVKDLRYKLESFGIEENFLS